MHYLIHGPAAYAIVEDAAQAQKHVDAGWTRATKVEVMARWRARDDAALAKAAPASETAPLKREGTIVTRMGGWTVYGVQGKKVE